MKAKWNDQILAESDATVVVDGQRNENAAWCYPEPKEKASNIRDSVAFWKGVEVGE